MEKNVRIRIIENLNEVNFRNKIPIHCKKKWLCLSTVLNLYLWGAFTNDIQKHNFVDFTNETHKIWSFAAATNSLNWVWRIMVLGERKPLTNIRNVVVH